MIAGGGYGSNSGTACGPGSPMFAILSADAPVGVGSAETLQYSPPAGSTLTGGTARRRDVRRRQATDASGTAVAYTPEYAYDGSNVFFQCASGLTPCAPGQQRLRRRARTPRRPWREPVSERRLRERPPGQLQPGRQRRRLVAGAAVLGEPAAVQQLRARRQRRRRHAARAGARGERGTRDERGRPGGARRVQRDRRRPTGRRSTPAPRTPTAGAASASGTSRWRADVRLQPAVQAERVRRLPDPHDRSAATASTP